MQLIDETRTSGARPLCGQRRAHRFRRRHGLVHHPALGSSCQRRAFWQARPGSWPTACPWPNTPRSSPRRDRSRCPRYRAVTRLLLLDNYDSFTWNLAHLFGALPEVHVDVMRNDAFPVRAGATTQFDGVVMVRVPVGRVPRRADGDDSRRRSSRRAALRSVFGLQGIGEAFGGRSCTRRVRCMGRPRRSPTTVAAFSPAAVTVHRDALPFAVRGARWISRPSCGSTPRLERRDPSLEPPHRPAGGGEFTPNRCDETGPGWPATW